MAWLMQATNVSMSVETSRLVFRVIGEIGYSAADTAASINAVIQQVINTYGGVNYYAQGVPKKIVTRTVQVNRREVDESILPHIEGMFVVKLGGVFQEIGGDHENVGGGNQKLG